VSDFSVYYTKQAGGDGPDPVCDLVHVKSSAAPKYPVCGFDPKDAPLAWTSYESARFMATCAECLHEVLKDECSCYNGTISSGGCDEDGCCTRPPCRQCDVDAAEAIIENRRLPK